MSDGPIFLLEIPEGGKHIANMKLENLNLLDKFLFDETMEDKGLSGGYQHPAGEGSKDFNLLNESCFILIAPFDIFGRGLYRYTFEGVCRECPDLKLKDGAVRIFINTKGENREDFSQEFLDFMEYIGMTTDEMAENVVSKRIKKIHERVRSVRKSEKAGLKYMQRWEELAYAREDGEIAGALKRLIAQVCKKMKKNKTLEAIAEELEEEISVIEPIYNTAKDFAPEYDLELVFERINAKK